MSTVPEPDIFGPKTVKKPSVKKEISMVKMKKKTDAADNVKKPDSQKIPA